MSKDWKAIFSLTVFFFKNIYKTSNCLSEFEMETNLTYFINYGGDVSILLQPYSIEKIDV